MFNKRIGVSLVEVTIVLAISSLLLIIAVSTFSMRTRTVVDDAAKQVESAYQKARNEAVQGLGTTTGKTFSAGDELFGQAIQFRNNCRGTQSCLTVFKLKSSASKTNISSYESYDVLLREGLEFDLQSLNCTYSSCYQQPGDSMKRLNESPIAMVFGVPMIVLQNGNGGGSVFANQNGVFGNPIAVTNIVNYIPSRQGKLQIAFYRKDNSSQTAQTAPHRYFLTFDLQTGDVTLQKQ